MKIIWDGVVVFSVIVFMLAAGILGFNIGQHTERSKPKVQIVKGADCPLPAELEVLVLMVSRDDADHVRQRCTTVMRWRVDPS